VSRFSARSSWDTEESGYAAAVREARASGRRLYDLTVSNPTVCGFDYETQTVLGALADPRALTYDPDPRGMRSAREAIADYYAEGGPGWVSARVDPDSLLLTTSTSEAYGFLFRLLCDAGDEVLVAQPSYPLFDLLADLEDVTLRSYPLFYEHGRGGGWWIDFAELERGITPRTRAILVVHPNNPTGHWTGPREREVLQEICARHGLALIVDEVFLDYSLIEPEAGLARVSSFAMGPHPVLTFVLSGLSKIAALPQMKVAWIAVLGPQGERAEAYARLEIVADAFLSMSAPAQLALPVWLASRHRIHEQIRQRTRGNLALLAKYAEGPSGLMLLQAGAGWSAIIGVPGCAGKPDCIERLARERGVIVHPGSFYGMAEANRAVVSLIGPAEEFAEGASRLLRQKFQ
jgi:aspartate/methionine/tyrosine aminotransferase